MPSMPFLAITDLNIKHTKTPGTQSLFQPMIYLTPGGIPQLTLMPIVPSESSSRTQRVYLSTETIISLDMISKLATIMVQQSFASQRQIQIGTSQTRYLLCDPCSTAFGGRPLCRLCIPRIHSYQTISLGGPCPLYVITGSPVFFLRERTHMASDGGLS